MTIYVDDPRSVGGEYHFWCHMFTDSELADLHTFAKLLGLKRHWFQGNNLAFPHYDISPTRRSVALQLGAVSKPLKDFIRERRQRVNVGNEAN